MGKCNASVIIPAYNQPEPLGKCINSLAIQDYGLGRFEVIVVDDGSERDVSVIAREAREKHPKLKLRYCRIDHSGQAEARNVGLGMARGDLILFLDHDCTVRRDWISKMSAIHDEYPEVAGIGGYVENFYRDNVFSEVSNEILNEALNENFTLIGACSSYKKGVLKEIGFFRTYVSGEDAELSCRAIRFGYEIKKLRGVSIVHHHELTLLSFLKQAFWYGRMDYKVKKEYSDLFGSGNLRQYFMHSLKRLGLVWGIQSKQITLSKKYLSLILVGAYVFSYSLAVLFNIIEENKSFGR